MSTTLLPPVPAREREHETFVTTVPMVSRPTLRWPTRIILATDGSAAADAGFRVARAFARRVGAEIDIVAVYTPRIPLPTRRGPEILEHFAHAERREIAELLCVVRRQMRNALDEPRHLAEQRLHVEVGDAGPAIARAAEATHADLAITSVKAALNTARFATTPVFAAAEGCEVPTCAIVPMLDGRVHSPTLRAAVASLVPGARLWIAITRSRRSVLSEVDTIESARQFVTRMCGPSWQSHLDEIEIMRVETPGEPVAAILRLANDVDAHLIAVPNYGEPGPVRTFLPNVGDALLLDASCSVLVVPNDTSAARSTALGSR